MNLAPAELRKEGSGFDLPIALAVLAASRQVPPESLGGHAAVGELALDGRLRPVGGVLAAAEGARQAGLARLLCAAESAAEAALAGIEPVPVQSPGRGSRLPARRVAAASARRARHVERGRPRAHGPDLADVRGQERARRALELAAAGGHNLLLGGPPGHGKDDARAAAARASCRRCRRTRRSRSRASTRSPDCSRLVGPLVDACRRSGRRITARRWRRSSAAAPSPRPGEASLAHRGVLLLDELAGVPAPRARGAASAARGRRDRRSPASAGRIVFPARFQLVATMNLCPCGARGDPAAECSCSAQRLAAFRDKLSRALLDRFDLVVTVPRPRARELDGAPGEASEAVRRAGASRSRAGIRRAAAAHGGAKSCSRGRSSGCRSRARGRARVARVARTVAALAGAEAVAPEHVAEALSYRSPTELDAVSELALAAFAAETGAHVVEEPREQRFARFARTFDERAYRTALAARDLRFARPRRAGVPAAAARSATRRPGSSCAARRRSSSSTGRPSRSSAPAHARRTARRSRALLGAGARRSRARRRQRPGPRRRRRGAPRRTRGGRRHRRRARLRRRPRLPGRARASSPRGSASAA